MSILADLRAALEAKHEAIRRCQQDHCEAALSEMAYLELYSALGTYRKLRTDDTIRALLDVAERSMQNTVCVCGKVWRYENHYHADNCPLAPLVKEVDHDRA